MVSSILKHSRLAIPFFGLLALLMLFLKLPGISSCKICSTPYMPFIGGAYFSILIALSLLFPRFPSPSIARAGLIWAVLLFVLLTYRDLPQWCAPCVSAHLCHSALWTIWL